MSKDVYRIDKYSCKLRLIIILTTGGTGESSKAVLENFLSTSKTFLIMELNLKSVQATLPLLQFVGLYVAAAAAAAPHYFLPFHPAKIYLDILTIYIINNLRVNQDNFLTLCLPIKLSRILTEY